MSQVMGKNHYIISKGKGKVPYGYFVIFDERINILYKKNKDSEPEPCIFYLKIMKKREVDTMKELDFTISLENDVFFLQKSTFCAEDFENLKTQQKTRINFEQFGYEVIKILKEAQQSNSNYSILFKKSEEENEWVLEITQTIELKKINILSLTFKEASEKAKLMHANRMFDLMKKNIERKSLESSLFYKTIKEKDPILYQLRFKK